MSNFIEFIIVPEHQCLHLLVSICKIYYYSSSSVNSWEENSTYCFCQLQWQIWLMSYHDSEFPNRYKLRFLLWRFCWQVVSYLRWLQCVLAMTCFSSEITCTNLLHLENNFHNRTIFLWLLKYIFIASVCTFKMSC